MDLPDEILLDSEAVREASIIPPNSSAVYRKTYDAYLAWKLEKKISADSEPVLLSYFRYLEKKFAPTTLWVKYSHLNASILLHTGISLQKYEILKKYLKRTNEGYEAKKAPVLTQTEIFAYLQTAPPTSLVSKIILIFSFVGAMRKTDLYNLKFTDVVDQDEKIKVCFDEVKNKRRRTFFIVNDDAPQMDIISLVREYMDKRRVCKLPFFFMQIRNGKIWGQRVGEHTFSDNCKIIARFLKLEQPERYTSHCARRSAATAMAENGVPFMDIKNYVGWRSDRAAQGYIDQSDSSKISVARTIMRTDTIQAGSHLDTNTVATTNSLVPNISIGTGNTFGSFNVTINVLPNELPK